MSIAAAGDPAWMLRFVRAFEHDLGLHLTSNHYLGLAAHVTALERHGIDLAEWTITPGGCPVGIWRVCPDCRRVWIGDASEFALAQFVLAERHRARLHLARIKAEAYRSIGMGWHRGKMAVLQPSKCRGCGTRAAQPHTAYSPDCMDAHAERILSQSD